MSDFDAELFPGFYPVDALRYGIALTKHEIAEYQRRIEQKEQSLATDRERLEDERARLAAFETALAKVAW